MAGRPASADWNQVIRKGKKCECKHCGVNFKASVDRIQQHFCEVWDGHRQVRVCEKAPDAVKKEFQDRRNTAVRVKEKKRRQKENADRDAAEYKKQKQSGIKQGFARVEKQNLDKAVGRFFYANGIAFHAADSPEWHELVEELKGASTGYKSPGRESLRTTVLLSVRTELDDKLRHAGLIEFEVADDAEAAEVAHHAHALCSDGWTSTSRRPLLNVVLVCTKGAYFVKAIDTSGKDKTAQYQTAELSAAIDAAGEHCITAVFVDGGVPASTRADLEQEYPSLFVLLCAAHSVDLLLEDFYKQNTWVKETVDALREVVKFIRNHHKPLALFRQLSKLELLKPGDTRFGSNFVMLQRALAVQDELEELVGSKAWKQWVKRQKKAAKKAKAAEIKKTITHEKIWKQAATLVKVSKPFVVTMKMADGDVPAMGKLYKRMFDAIEELKAISTQELPAGKRDALVKAAEERWVYMDHPVHRAAYAFDPEYQQHSWNCDEDIIEGIENVLERYYGDDTQSIAAAQRQLEEYRTRQGRFGKAACVMNMELMSGWSWWSTYGGAHPEIQRVAMDILSLVGGACSCERNWSVFDFIHSKKRNKLSPEKAEELVYIFSNLRLLRKLTTEGREEAFYGWQKAQGTDGAEANGANPVGNTTSLAVSTVCDTSSGEDMEDDELDDSEIEESGSDCDDEP